MAKDGVHSDSDVVSENSVIRSDGTLNKEKLTKAFQELHESFNREHRHCAYDNDELGCKITDAKREVVAELAYIFGLEYTTKVF